MKFVGMGGRTRLRLALSAPLLASSFLVAGCMSDPTYGTGKSASVQLAEDLTGVLSLAPKNREQIAYKPRPELVKPAPGQELALPAPQTSVASVSNPDWPEAPEAKRARLKKEITENRDDPSYESPIQGTMATAETGRRQSNSDIESPRAHDAGRRDGDSYNSARQRAEFNRRLAESRQGSPTARKYLSQPPLVYRQPADSAPVNDVGEDELKKERRRKAEARKAAGGGNSWRDIIPGL